MATGQTAQGDDRSGGEPAVVGGLRVPLADHPYAPFLASLEKPARYAGGEVGAVRKPWAGVQARICLAFPDVFEVGMSHLGSRILYALANAHPRALAERCYCPWPDLEAELRRRGLPLISLESRRPLRQFDVVGISLQFELTYTNVLTMLDLGQIPLRAAARGEEEPLVLGGGPNALHPEPVADFFDAFVVGDGERKLLEVALRWTKLRDQGVGRSERLARLAQMESVYVPGAYPTAAIGPGGLQTVLPPTRSGPSWPVRRAAVDLDEFPFPTAGPMGGPEAVFDRTSLEIARGCHEGCRFCQAGMANRPLRERDPAQLLTCAMSSIELTGTDEISLTALSPADASFIHPLIRTMGGTLAARGVGLGVSSLRAYGLEPDLLDELKRMRAAGLTFAPEAGTQRLRDAINKNVSEAELIEAAERVFARGWNRIKLYFMIGLPTETDEDVRGIIDTAVRTLRAGRAAAGKRVRLTVSVSNHVPKPHTPFQWEAMASLDALRRKQDRLRQLVRAHAAITLRLHDAPASRLEAVLARGDRRLSAVIERAGRLGARFDSWTEQLVLEHWSRAFEELGIDGGLYLGEAEPDAATPWSHIDVGLDQVFLERERSRALRSKPSSPCGRRASGRRPGASEPRAEAAPWVCYRCGAGCDLDAMEDERTRRLERLDTAPAPAGPAPEAVERPSGAGGPARIGSARAGFRYRAQFEKLGAAALVGHLDLIREMGRIFRRVGVELVHTAGFRPKPIMTFAPALALGVGGLAELLDLRLAARYDAQERAELVDRVNDASPDGLRFRELALLPAGAPSIGKLCGAVRYWVVLEPSELQQGWARVGAATARGGAQVVDWLTERCRQLMGRDHIWVDRGSRGRSKKRDIRPFLRSAQIADRVDPAVLTAAGWSAEAVCAQLEVLTTAAGSAKPAELAVGLLGDPLPPYGMLRAALLTEAPDGQLVPIDTRQPSAEASGDSCADAPVPI